MRRALHAVEGRQVALGVGQRIGRLDARGVQRLLDLLLVQVVLDVLAVVVLGHAQLIQRLMPLLGRLVARAHLGHVVVYLRLVHRYLECRRLLAQHLVVYLGVQDVVAHGLGDVVVFGHPLAPRFLGGYVALLAHLLDVARDLVLLDLHAVDRGGHAPGEPFARAPCQHAGAQGCRSGSGQYLAYLLHVSQPFSSSAEAPTYYSAARAGHRNCCQPGILQQLEAPALTVATRLETRSVLILTFVLSRNIELSYFELYSKSK